MNHFKQQNNPVRQAANFWLVALLHLVFFYLVVTGLGRTVVEVLKGPISATVIEEPKLRDPPLPLPMPPRILPPPQRDFMQMPQIILSPHADVPRQFTDQKPDAPAERVPQEPASPAVVRTEPVIDAARACAKPDYPASAIRAGWQGLVELDFLIGLDGRVVESRIAKSSGHDRLDAAARDGLSLCRFVPGTVDGKPERSWAHIRYNWQLDR